jgi:hypothetical protein
MMVIAVLAVEVVLVVGGTGGMQVKEVVGSRW